MTPGIQTLLAALGGGTVVAIINGIFGTRQARKTFENQRQMAVDQWTRERRAAAEARVAEQRSQAYVDAVVTLEPLHKATIGDPPSPLEWEETSELAYPVHPPGELMARLRVYGTPEAVDLFSSTYEALRECVRLWVASEALQEDAKNDVKQYPELRGTVAGQRYRELISKDVQALQASSLIEQRKALASLQAFQKQISGDLVPAE
jgi:hypothetical protein